MEMFKPFGPIRRYGIVFGKGEAPEDFTEYQAMTDYGQALIDAWSNGCPIPDEVMTTGGYSPQTAQDRYKDVNKTYTKVILPEVAKYSRPLARQLNRFDVSRPKPKNFIIFLTESPKSTLQEFPLFLTLKAIPLPVR